MKKMSEVFELPLAGEESQGETFLSDKNYYFASFDDELSYGDGKGLERAQYAAHAINHVDALADALESMLVEVKCMAHSKWDANTEGSSTFELSDELLEFNSAFGDEIAALAAYRGEK